MHAEAPRFLRALLVYQGIEQRELAKRSGLAVATVNRILREQVRPGELATIKLKRGLQILGIPTSVLDSPPRTFEVLSEAERVV